MFCAKVADIFPGDFVVSIATIYCSGGDVVPDVVNGLAVVVGVVSKSIAEETVVDWFPGVVYPGDVTNN